MNGKQELCIRFLLIDLREQVVQQLDVLLSITIAGAHSKESSTTLTTFKVWVSMLSRSLQLLKIHLEAIMDTGLKILVLLTIILAQNRT